MSKIAMIITITHTQPARSAVSHSKKATNSVMICITICIMSSIIKSNIVFPSPPKHKPQNRTNDHEQYNGYDNPPNTTLLFVFSVAVPKQNVQQTLNKKPNSIYDNL